MARRRNRKGQFVKSRRRSTARRRTTRRRRPRVAVAVANPRRRRVYRRRRTRAYTPRRRRSYRRNPALFRGNRILGMSLREIAYTGVGFIAPPAIEGFVSQWIPASISGNAAGRYAVKVGIVAGTSLVGGKILGREAGRFVAIGGVTYIVANLLIDYAPQLFSGFGSQPYLGRSGVRAYMNPGRTMGRYLSNASAMSVGGGSTADRLSPNTRF